MQLSKKLKSFVVFFLLFLKSAYNFKHLTKTMIVPSSFFVVTVNVTDWENIYVSVILTLRTRY